jgi:predicted porin
MSSLLIFHRNFTMKKSLIAMAVAATVATPMVASAAMLQSAGDQEGINLYGSFRPQYTNQDSASIIRDGGSRWGIQGTHDLGNGAESFYHLERKFDTSNANFSTDGRLAFAGLRGGWGSLTAGQQWVPYYDAVVSPNDPFPTIGATNWYGIAAGQLNRVGNNLTYKLPGGMAIGGGLAVIVDGDRDEPGVVEDNDIDSTSLGLTAKAGPVDLGFGWNEVSSAAFNGDDVTRIGLTAAMDAGPVRLGIMWENVDIDEEADTGSISPWSVIASGWGFTAQWADQDRAEDTGTLALMYGYRLSGNTRIQVAWETADNKDDDIALIRYRVDF